MRVPFALLLAFVTYSLLGICPMQMSMMSMNQDDMNGKMMMAVSHEVAIQDMGACNNCLKALDEFALKETQTFANEIPLIVAASLPVLQQSLIDLAHLSRVSHRLARAGPILSAPSIVETIVLRT